ncbi:conserved protein of unknown function [Candidatus Hydrogenisulfobacillus filiaventi]|uniref:DUF2283 domain-containing protein n=1 Tax=Candidatus Hydrogenisulfobacillus filiaventi TaxID=2707344 RepID=A0A6F8ZIE7_9FIRM|nr:conserved protein of unknown function [Candidatus Hydrogenisulfobacillus filiaventi]
MFGFDRFPHTYDPEADALYVRLGPGPVARQMTVTPAIIADLAANGGLVGLEILDPRHHAEMAARWLASQPMAQPQ